MSTIEVEELGCPYPAPVTTTQANGEGDGTTITLTWTGYDEQGQGDIASYRLFAETTPFTSLAGLQPKAEVQAGSFSAAIQGLARHATYSLAVLAVDQQGHCLTTAAPITSATSDTVPPAEVTKGRGNC